MDQVWVQCRRCAGTGLVGDDICTRCDGNEGWGSPEAEAPEPDEHGERWA